MKSYEYLFTSMGFTAPQASRLQEISRKAGFQPGPLAGTIAAAQLGYALSSKEASVMKRCDRELGLSCIDVRPSRRRDIVDVGLDLEEKNRLREVARRARATPAEALLGIVQNALGSSFKSRSLQFRLIDACNTMSVPQPS